MPRIRDIAQICKSKNAGPFLVTIDVLFEDHAVYREVKATGVLNAALFARLYGVPEEDVLFTPYDAAAAFKATLPRLCRPATSATHGRLRRPAARAAPRRRDSDRPPGPLRPEARPEDPRRSGLSGPAWRRLAPRRHRHPAPPRRIAEHPAPEANGPRSRRARRRGLGATRPRRGGADGGRLLEPLHGAPRGPHRGRRRRLRRPPPVRGRGSGLRTRLRDPACEDLRPERRGTTPTTLRRCGAAARRRRHDEVIHRPPARPLPRGKFHTRMLFLVGAGHVLRRLRHLPRGRRPRRPGARGTVGRRPQRLVHLGDLRRHDRRRLARRRSWATATGGASPTSSTSRSSESRRWPRPSPPTSSGSPPSGSSWGSASGPRSSSATEPCRNSCPRRSAAAARPCSRCSRTRPCSSRPSAGS